MLEGARARDARGKRILVPSRVRRIERGFSWIDRRFVREFAPSLGRDEILLYFFLVAVADRNGVSFYGDPTASALLKLDPRAIAEARRGLVAADLVAYERPLYQVLALPGRESATRGASAIGEILRDLARGEGS